MVDVSMNALLQYRKRADKALKAFLATKRRELQRQTPRLVPLFDRTADFVLRKGGKRVRGFLVTLGYQLIRKRTNADVQRLSLIAELCHASLLIHDDIIDRDDRRRGGPTVHVALRRHAPNQANANQYGTSQAILLGSLLGIWARQLVLESSFPSNVKLRALGQIESMMEATHAGEMLDVALADLSSASDKEIITVHLLKTARYTFESPLRLGALLAGASKRDLTTLSAAALPLGIAFQIQDDILGLFGDERTIGKSVTSDLAEGKKTLLINFAFRYAAASDRIRLRTLMAKRTITQSILTQVQSIVRGTGALEANQALAQELVEQAKHALTQNPRFDTTGRKQFLQIADFVIERNH